ncbi:MAG: ribosome-associated translation inhibitor RaiA [bacterium]|nr:ribosome-associated translation inhibitor RaiA [bacterium]
MQLTVTGKHVDTGQAFKEHINKKIDTLKTKYSIEPIDATVSLSRVGHDHAFFRSDLTLHLGRGVVIRCHGEGNQGYNCFDAACEKLESKLRKHKERLTDHHQKRKSQAKQRMAPHYILSEDVPYENGKDLSPPVIAEMQEEIPTFTVSDALVHLDLCGEDTVVFHNDKHGRLNVLYRRSDGKIGWIDPQG